MANETIGGWHISVWDDEMKASAVEYIRNTFEALIADIEAGRVRPIVVNKVWESEPASHDGAILDVFTGVIDFSVRWYDPRQVKVPDVFKAGEGENKDG